MTADVQDVQPDLTIVQGNDVQAISGKFVAGPINPSEVRPTNARRLAGQERLLDFGRRLQVTGHPVVGLQQSRVGLLQLDLQAAELQMRLDTRVQFLHLKRLGDVVHPAGGKGLYFVELLRESADEDDGDSLELV